MVKDKIACSVVLRRRDNITANETSLSSSDEEYCPIVTRQKETKSIDLSPSKPQVKDSERVTRRSSRNSKTVETDENGLSKDQDDEGQEEKQDIVQDSTENESGASSEGETEDNADDDIPESNRSHCSDDELFTNVRRSSRRRSLIYGSYQYQNSWIFGGGPVARGYPRREDPEDIPEDNGHDRRRSSRLIAKPTYSNGRDTENDADGNDSEDMYSRVKRRTSFSGTDKEAECNKSHRRGRGPSQKDEEPVARRLRDRTTLSIGNTFDYELEKQSRKKSKKTRRKRRRQSSSSSSSSSSDSDDEQKSPSKKRPRKRFHARGGRSIHTGQHSKREKMMLMEAQPIEVDPSINFQSVGGLGQFIGKLKEIVLFPLLYSEFYSETKIRPPRGILLHGPPGTGKTLLARALATECSNINGKKVSFFLRKGADLLNKWIGESERQLRVLFEQAALHQPSIIFFDEIDGLAPCRSSKSDQVHNSIVSTLLAELDGLQDRGQVIVIGSTNRLDFVDPALRRPGRFDCELPIFLPTRDGRRDILRVLIRDWKDPVSEEMLDNLADRSIGFSGADLKLLCWTTCMNSLRRRYPQIYTSTQKYLLNYDSIKRELEDWELALKTVSPSTNRSIFSKYSPAQPLPLFVKPLLDATFDKAVQGLDSVFPWQSLSVISENSTKRLALCSDIESGVDEYIVPALLHVMETLPVFVLSSESLFIDNFAAECTVTQICMEAAKHSGPCIMYIPNADKLCSLLSSTAKEVLIQMVTQSLRKPILILATTHGRASLRENEEFWKLFSGSFLNLSSPSGTARRSFFQSLFLEQAITVKVSNEGAESLEELQVAPAEIPQKKKLSEDELREIEKRETAVLRGLRIFLREILLKLARNKKFTEFTKPVDVTEVPDYLDVIESPMDLETMMFKLNMGEYMSAGQFLDDIKLIANNCLNYNPHKDESGKRLRMRAYELLDFANTLIEKEMDSDYEDQCKEILKAREERIAEAEETQNEGEGTANRIEEPTSSSVVSKDSNTVVKTPVNNFSQSQGSSTAGSKRRKKSSWSRGKLTKGRKLITKAVNLSPSVDIKVDAPCEAVKECEADSSNSIAHGNELLDIVDNQQSCSYTADCNLVWFDNQVKYKDMFNELLEETVKASRDFSVVRLLNLRFSILRLLDKHQFNEKKDDLAKEIQALLASTAKNSLTIKIVPSSNLTSLKRLGRMQTKQVELVQSEK